MKRTLIILSILLAVLFNGCASSSNVQAPTDVTFNFKKINDSDTLYEVNYSKKGKYFYTYPIVLDAMLKIRSEVEKREYRYFQIVTPYSISNINGFPITSITRLNAFLNPQLSMPTEELNFLETRKTLMDNQTSQVAVDVPMTIFQDTKFNLVIRLVKEPEEDEIVWDINSKEFF